MSPGAVFVGLGFLALTSIIHCSPIGSAHMGTSPILFSSPGKQIQSFVPWRRMMRLPSEPISATVASLVICRGPDDIALTILAVRMRSSCVETWIDMAQLLLRNRKLHDLRCAGNRLVRRIRELKPHFVWTRRESDEHHGLTAGVDGRPGLVVHVVVEVAKPRRHRERRRTEDRKDPQVFSAVLNEDPTQRQRF